jgi:hypothetical protein
MTWVEFLTYLLGKAAGRRVNVMLENAVVAGGGGCGVQYVARTEYKD